MIQNPNLHSSPPLMIRPNTRSRSSGHIIRNPMRRTRLLFDENFPDQDGRLMLSPEDIVQLDFDYFLNQDNQNQPAGATTAWE